MSFPDPVNEVAARVVAGGVAVMAWTAVLAGLPWLVVPLAYGFVARVLAGPRWSPLGRLATQVVVPRLPWPARPVPGPPKRFAQGIGAALTVTAAVCWLALGWTGVTLALIALVAVAATLEAALALCIGCHVFRFLLRRGILPERVCVACADVGRRSPTRTVPSTRPPAG